MAAIGPTLAVTCHPDLDNSADWLWCGIMDIKYRLGVRESDGGDLQGCDFVSAGLNEDQSWSA
jgi:hypothetical protein